MIKVGRLVCKTLRVRTANFSGVAEKFNQITRSDDNTPARPSGDYRYVNGELVPITSLVLHQRENIEQYVIKIVKDYYRSTYKSGITLESNLSDHGLDSLDAIELAMQVEEDLGYKISAENLSVFHKVKHFVTFIEQVEAFKKTYNQDPLA